MKNRDHFILNPALKTNAAGRELIRLRLSRRPLAAQGPSVSSAWRDRRGQRSGAMRRAQGWANT
ncbi:MAG: hypothetical protein OXU61_03460 [Gammaproteobacteria bacterium]|nr:hypothetical protein [Gammaproteobacteria bacterium]